MIEEKIKSLFGENALELIQNYSIDYLDLKKANVIGFSSTTMKLLSISIPEVTTSIEHTLNIYSSTKGLFINDYEKHSKKRCSISIYDNEQTINISGYKNASGIIAYEEKKYKNLAMYYDLQKCKMLFDKKLEIADRDNESLFGNYTISTNEKYEISPTDVFEVSTKKPILDMIKYTKENIIKTEQLENLKPKSI